MTKERKYSIFFSIVKFKRKILKLPYRSKNQEWRETALRQGGAAPAMLHDRSPHRKDHRHSVFRCAKKETKFSERVLIFPFPPLHVRREQLHCRRCIRIAAAVAWCGVAFIDVVHGNIFLYGITDPPHCLYLTSFFS